MPVPWADTFWAEALATNRTKVPKNKFSATTPGATAFGPTGVLHCEETTALLGASVLEPYK